MKRSQMELMGLAVIMVLITLALLFVFRFAILQNNDSTDIDFQESEMAADYLFTLIDTTSPHCSDSLFSTLIKDCARHGSGHGIGGSIQCTYPTPGDSIYSCAYLKKILEEIFSSTFEKYNMDYYFIISRQQDPDLDDPEYILGPFPADGTPDCDTVRIGKQQPLSMNDGTDIYLSLYICKP